MENKNMSTEKKIGSLLNMMNEGGGKPVWGRVNNCVNSLVAMAKNKKIKMDDVWTEMAILGLHPDDDYPDVEQGLELEGIKIIK